MADTFESGFCSRPRLKASPASSSSTITSRPGPSKSATRGCTPTSIEQIVEGRQGVCQDFTHLLLGMCRSIGIPARYASGYIAERGQSAEANAPSRGVGASHAWVEAFTPTHGWRGFDPTNNLVANEYYVKIGIGRDYSDAPPTRGTYHGGPPEKLSVAVTARALD